MWGGRFQHQASDLFRSFNDSLPVDYQLAKQDIQGSLVWAQALNDAKVLNDFEYIQIKRHLEELLEEVKLDPSQMLTSNAEDIHSWVEQQLIARAGELGKKLHTGRSRNDQVLTDLKLWCKKQSKELGRLLKQTVLLLEDKAVFFSDAIMPSYTHLQRAQPITFGFWLNAAAQMLMRDNVRLNILTELSDECPLGSSAIAGTAFDVDREKIAVQLGFARATNNALDTVSDRDFVIDFLYCSSTSLLHLSRLAEDLIFFNTQEAGFITLDDSVTSGSSLMPQKKNPDALELIRGKSAEGYALLSQMMMAVKSLPLGYNKDLQQDKSALFSSLKSWRETLLMFQQVIDSLSINKETMASAVENSFANATELADYLVNLGVPFRDAHDQTGKLVLIAEQKQCFLHNLILSDFQAINPKINADVYQWLSTHNAINRRLVKGGVGSHWQHAKNALDYQVHEANLQDVDALYDVIRFWSEQGENLPRTKEDIINQLASFRIIKNRQGELVACGCLHIYDEHLVEIRSLSVSPSVQNQGLGRRLVYALLAQCQQLNLGTAFVLTRQPKFFQSCGFESSSIEQLPKKVLKDCQFCPRKEHCDEVALIYEL